MRHLIAPHLLSIDGNQNNGCEDVKESKCRFIEEYANFQIRLFEKDMELNPDMKWIYIESIEKINLAVKGVRRGRLTVNEAMTIINKPMNIY